MKTFQKIVVLGLFSSLSVNGAETLSLPLTCSELLPAMQPYISFFENVAEGRADKEPQMTKRMFKILSLRDRVDRLGDQTGPQNPVDILIQKTLCYYRTQKEPLRPVSFQDPQFLSYLRTSLKDLEEKTEETILDLEVEKKQREGLVKGLEKNHEQVRKLRQAADVEAEKTFKKLSSIAAKKTRN